MEEDEEQRRIVADRERRKWNDERIRSGKMVDGWKLVRKIVTTDDSPYEPHEWPYYVRNAHQIMSPPWPKDGKDAAVDRSVLVSILQKKHTHRGVCIQNRYVIRRYSLIAPGVYDVIANVSCDGSEFYAGVDEWWPDRPMYVTDNIVAIGCHKKGSDKIRIVWIDINTKSYQLLETTSPKEDAVIRSIVKGPSNDGFSILFQVCKLNVDATFHVADYVITPTDSVRSPIVQQTASRQLDWPQGDWHFDSMIGGRQFSLGFSGVFYGMDRYANAPLQASRVVSFDRYGFHDLGAANEWVRKFKRTSICSRIVEAKKSFENLAPQGSYPYQLHRSHLFVGGNEMPFFHRPLSPPSQSYCDAETFCLANPDDDFAHLKDVIGFDVFDGIDDGKPPIELQM